MWYTLVGDDQVGPLDVGGLLELFQQGRIDAETFVWREGMDEWVPFETVPELAQAVLLAQGSGVEELDDGELEAADEGATLMMIPDDGADIARILESVHAQRTPLAAAVAAPLVPRVNQPAVTRNSTASAPTASAQPAPVKAAPPLAQAASVHEQPTPAAQPAPRPARPLDALKAPPEIDFGAMADGLEPEHAAPVPGPSTAAAPAKRRPMWIGLLVPLFAGATTFAVKWMMRPTDGPTVNAPESSAPEVVVTPPATVAPTPATATPPTVAPTPATATPPTVAPPTVAPPTVAPAPATAAAPPSATRAPTRAPTPATRAPAPATRAPAPPTAAPPPAGGEVRTLSRNDLLGVIKANEGKWKACGAQAPDLKGLFTVSTTIERDGSVSAAQVVTARFRDSAIGPCVEGKVKAFKFPKFSGDPMKVQLPLSL
jgi:hypothetical protein